MDTRIAVIGMGIFGKEVALALSAHGHSALAIDISTEAIDQVKDHVAQALILDTTDEDALYEAKVDRVSVAVNAIGTQHIENSILTTALLCQLEIPRIIARASNRLHGRILRQVGATEIVSPEQDMGRRIANQIAHPGFRELLALAEGVCVAELPVPLNFVGQTLEKLDVRRRHRVTVIGVQRTRFADDITGAAPRSGSERDAESLLGERRRMILNIQPDKDVFLDDDVIIVIGHEDDVRRLADLGQN